MAEPVRARRLTDQEGQRLQQIVRRGKHGSIRVRRAMIIMASASGTPVPAIARLVAADQDTVRDVIHLFNQKGLAALDPRWAGGRPRLISDEDVDFIVAAATTRPEKLGQPFTRWSLRKLVALPGAQPGPGGGGSGGSGCGRSCIPGGISFQRTRTWKESADPDKDAKLDVIEHVTSTFPDRCFAFDQFGPLSIRPSHGTCWARRTAARPAAGHVSPHPRDPLLPRLLLPRPMTSCGASPGCARAATTPWPRSSPSGPPAPTAPPIYVILDNLSANKTPAIRTWAAKHKVRLCFTPDQRLVGQPDRGAIRALAHLCHGRLGPPQPRRAGPPPAGLPGLAQRQRPPPRRPGRPAPRTRPHPQRTPATLGPAQTQGRVIRPGTGLTDSANDRSCRRSVPEGDRHARCAGHTPRSCGCRRSARPSRKSPPGCENRSSRTCP